VQPAAQNQVDSLNSWQLATIVEIEQSKSLSRSDVREWIRRCALNRARKVLNRWCPKVTIDDRFVPDQSSVSGSSWSADRSTSPSHG
jgi:hypothetical protein